ncbi:glutathione S-transferase family protein [Microcoleus sp. FACHB-831]|uniref:glutathione S-transferase family protein n=1 Tax=Microcoleus sp. FACHB-831 TaxID=2692827 RepID=UPI001684E657|nr:glutathione S-transferase family protein [Microcoleus sp. FACHB-831]MBD1923787.1 glutathione S-transferase family protein [Microcoleus sp. FACHB-831]
MLKLYHTPISANSRRVWIALLEKEIEFELVEMKLDGDQFQPEFMDISPFNHIPVLVDDDFSVVESLAILDYLEAKYPTPAMLPNNAKDIATVRMVQMVSVNELLPAMNPLIQQMMGFGELDSQKQEQSKQKVATALNFLENLIGDRSFFGANNLTLADIVAGTAVPWCPSIGVPLDGYPKLNAWCEQLIQRNSWEITQPTPEAIEAFKPRVKELMARLHSK